MGKLILFLVLVLLAGCSKKVRVYAEENPEYDFLSNREFRWYSSAERMSGFDFFSSPSTDEKMKEVISGQLSSRGYRFSDNENSLVIHHYLLLSGKQTTRHAYSGTGNSGDTQAVPPEKISGVFILYFVDQSSGRVVWRACTMYQLQNPALVPEEETTLNANALLEELIPAVFSRYPILPKTSD